MAKVPIHLQILPLLPVSLLKKVMGEIVKNSTLTGLEKSFLLWLVHTYTTGEIKLSNQQEKDWFDKRKISKYARKKLRKVAHTYLAKHVYRYYVYPTIVDNRYHEIKSFRDYMSIMSINKSLASYIIDVLNLGVYEVTDNKNTLRGMANPFVWQANVFKEALSLPANKSDIKHLLRTMVSAVNSSVYLLQLSLSIRYSQAHITDVPFLDMEVARDNKIHVSNAIKLLKEYKGDKYSSYCYMISIPQLLGLLSWLFVPKYIEEILSYVLPVARSFYVARELGKIPYSWLTLSNLVLYSSLYILPFITRNFNSAIKDLLSISMKCHDPYQFSLQMLNSLVEGLRWSILHGYFELAHRIKIYIKSNMPSVMPTYLVRSLLQYEVLEALLNIKQVDFDLALKQYKSNLKTYPPNSFFILFVSAVYELVHSINVYNVERAFRVGERIYQLAHKYDKLKDIAKVLRLIGRYGVGNAGRKFWKSMYDEVLKYYNKDPYSITIERGFPLLAWLYHKRTLEPIDKVLRTYRIPISLELIQKRMIKELNIDTAAIEAHLMGVSRASKHLGCILSEIVGNKG